MELHELVTGEVYRVVENQPWLKKTIFLRFEQAVFGGDGSILISGIDLTTNLICSVFANGVTFEKLSSLEKELL